MRPYPPRHGGVASLFELGIRREAVPHNVGRVVLVPQLRTALEQEVYDEELYAAIQACVSVEETKIKHFNFWWTDTLYLYSLKTKTIRIKM